MRSREKEEKKKDEERLHMRLKTHTACEFQQNIYIPKTHGVCKLARRRGAEARWWEEGSPCSMHVHAVEEDGDEERLDLRCMRRSQVGMSSGRE